ncbi:MAG: (2Fe-2S) ferredoxin domain-containing protein [Pirellulaceae bacterium]|nr:(2Fe-2S) ferredoxin domain-containing protein [Pirellulaceae bacterium]
MAHKDLNAARHRAKKLGFGKSNRTILLCMDLKEAGCASAKEMTASWKHLKKALKERHLKKHGSVVRLKMSCCDICKAGPIAVVMPDAIWYGRCTPEVIDRIIDEHLINGTPVEDFVISRPGSHEAPA